MHKITLAVAALALCAAHPALAQDVRSGLPATELFTMADTAMAEQRFADAEILYRALTRDPDIEIRSEARFRLGLLLEKQKRYRDAAIVFRALLDEKPNAPRVRLELAGALTAIGDNDGARRALRQAQAAGLPPDVAVLVDQFASALRSSKPFGGNLEVALAPDTNINRSTSATTLDTVIAPLLLDRDARAQSGLGVRIGAQGYARLPVAKNISLMGRVSGSAMLYRQGQFNDISTSIVLGPEILAGKCDRLRPAGSIGWRYYGGAFYARTQGASLNWMHIVGKRGQIETDASATRASYALNDLQDGWIYDGSVSVERAFSQKFGGSVSLSFDRQSARDPGYATASGGITILGWRDIGWSTVYANASYRHLESDARLFLYPERRTDDYVRVGAGAVFRKVKLAGLAPVARVAWERNRSTVGIYDYRRLSVEFGVTRAF